MQIRYIIFLFIISQIYCDTNDRPLPQYRTFNSTIIEQVIQNISNKINDPILRRIFTNSFPNTLDTTILHFDFNKSQNKYETFVITGDIPAEWTRDSTNQVLPYIQFCNEDQNLKNMLKGVINRQVRNILIDPYTNAYNYNTSNESRTLIDDSTRLVDGKPQVVRDLRIWERKYELDSLAAFLKLSNEFYFQTNDDSFLDDQWFNALQQVLNTVNKQSYGTFDELQQLLYPDYTFSRQDGNAIDTLSNSVGNPTLTCGLIKTAFRPSDDASVLNYLIPANAMLSVELNKTSIMLKDFLKNLYQQHKILQISKYSKDMKQIKNYINICEELSKIVRKAIYQNAVIQHHYTKKQIFAYEIDCYGNYYFMDDANIPSLLSLPYLGFVDKNDEIYLNTRELVLTKYNPYFFKGTAGEGVGGPHVGNFYIWPMSIIVRALTTDNEQEIIDCLKTLRNSTNGLYHMHESYYKDDPSKFTRPWFAWANSLFGELIISLNKTKPHLLKLNFENEKQ